MEDEVQLLIKIFGKTGCENRFQEIKIKLGDTVRDIKQVFYEHRGSPVEAQRMFFSKSGVGQIMLADSQTIASYGIENGDTVNIALVNNLSGRNLCFDCVFEEKRSFIGYCWGGPVSILHDKIAEKFEIPGSEQIIIIEGQEIPFDAENLSEFDVNPQNATCLYLEIQRKSRAKSARK